MTSYRQACGSYRWFSLSYRSDGGGYREFLDGYGWFAFSYRLGWAGYRWDGSGGKSGGGSYSLVRSGGSWWVGRVSRLCSDRFCRIESWKAFANPCRDPQLRGA